MIVFILNIPNEVFGEEWIRSCELGGRRIESLKSCACHFVKVYEVEMSDNIRKSFFHSTEVERARHQYSQSGH
jgi:hypothetical protein